MYKCRYTATSLGTTELETGAAAAGATINSRSITIQRGTTYVYVLLYSWRIRFRHTMAIRSQERRSRELDHLSAQTADPKNSIVFWAIILPICMYVHDSNPAIWYSVGSRCEVVGCFGRTPVPSDTFVRLN